MGIYYQNQTTLVSEIQSSVVIKVQILEGVASRERREHLTRTVEKLHQISLKLYLM